MDNERPKQKQEILKQFQEKANALQGDERELARAFVGLAETAYTANYRDRRIPMHNSYNKLCECDFLKLKTFEGFWNNKLVKVLKALFGEDETQHLRDVCELMLERPYSQSSYRPSYHSAFVGDYTQEMLYYISNIYDFLIYDLSLSEAIRHNVGAYTIMPFKIATALRNGDKEVDDLIAQAVLGEGEVELTYAIVRGIILSGVEKHIENLGKLLLAAKGQEGVRQMILENADNGTIATHTYFIKIILDNNLVRFSSVMRAFGTWTGLAFDDTKPKVVEKCIKLAYQYISGEVDINSGLESNDVTEIYMAYWALAYNDIYAAQDEAEKLINSQEKYRRLVGWYFLHNTVHVNTQHKLAITRLDVRDQEELAWICCNLYRSSSALNGYYSYKDELKISTYFDDHYSENKEERKKLFNDLYEVIKFIGNKKTKFEGCPFPWTWVQLESEDALKCIIGLVAYDRDSEMILRLQELLPCMDSYIREKYYLNILDTEDEIQRQFILGGLADKSTSNRELIIKKLENTTLTQNDIACLVSSLTTTSAALRKAIVTLLDKQTEELIRPAISALMRTKNNKQILAGLELLHIFSEKNTEMLDDFSEALEIVRNKGNIPDDIKVILQRFEKSDNDEYTAENGYGLYNVNAQDYDLEVAKSKCPKVKIYSREELAKILVPDKDTMDRLATAIYSVYDKHKDEECEVEYWDKRRDKVLLRDYNYGLVLLPDVDNKRNDLTILDYYFGDEFLEAVNNANISTEQLLVAYNYGINDYSFHTYKSYVFSDKAKKNFKDLPYDKEEWSFVDVVGNFSHKMFYIIYSLIVHRALSGDNSVFEYANSVLISLIKLIPNDELLSVYKANQRSSFSNSKDYMINIGIVEGWNRLAQQLAFTNEQFAFYWNEMWYYYLLTDKKFALNNNFKMDIARAYNLNLLSENGVYGELLTGLIAKDAISSYTSNESAYRKLSENPKFLEIVNKCVDRIVSIEEKRGEMPAALSHLAIKIGYYKGGAAHFAALLSALGKDSFNRGYVYSWSDSITKKESLSSLMKNCYPTSEDTPESFKQAVDHIPEKRLLQAIMYAPQWADFAEYSTGIKGLSSAVWLFHAHINERSSGEKETKIAVYSPISQKEFADGTFDKDWFLQAYKAVGAKVFDELYKNAKYITDSNSAHRRSQLYTDAVLGRLDKEQIKQEIADKRNQEKLRAYGLILLNKRNKKDALERYEFIQKFAKESKQFGAQKRASEAKAVMIALQNLAITTEFGNADRMTWYLESEKMDGLRHLMELHKLDEKVAVRLDFEEDGTPLIYVEKDGKKLKSLPAAHKKKELVLEIQTAVKDLKDQKKRAKLGFELAMVSRTAFGNEEILRLLTHPALSSMIKSLAFASKNTLGFLEIYDEKLVSVDYNGEVSEVTGDVTIAHPYDFIKNNCWSLYQKYLYKNQITQPFKQIFREYYPITEDEFAEQNISRRYAGNQIQPQKTVALLKTRGWTIDYEEGLQRVYHKENLIAKMYALADWFSPADIEAPTIEVVRFYTRDKYEPVNFNDISPVVFSEVMRDIDLVVSVAHVGGVDPEASHSTIEMRVAIASELLPLLGIANVKFTKNHALINGKLGEYSVHMGSGIVHQTGRGMIAVLPVHSQARGRIFLPFADGDPKTAEIMSKILLFAEDKKIKDASILSQIC